MTLGTADTVEAVPVQLPQFLIDKAQRGDVKTEITLEEEVAAPVSQGQRLGTLTVKSGEQVLKQIPLVAAESVERLSFWDLFVMVLKWIAMAKPA